LQTAAKSNGSHSKGRKVSKHMRMLSWIGI